SVKGYVDYLLAGIAGEISPVQRDFLERASVNTSRAMRLVADVVDVIRIDAGQWAPSLTNVPLAPVVAAIMSEVRSTAAARTIELAAEDATGVVVTADREMLQRTLSALIRRAVARSCDHGR